MRKAIIIIMVILGTFLLIGAVSAQEDTNIKKATVKIYDFEPGVLWAPQALQLKSGDAIAGYVEYDGNGQFQKGTGVTAWYVGSGLNGDIDPHHTKLIKAKFFFKNKKGKVKTKTVHGTGGHISTKLIKGYTPYKAKVTYMVIK